MEGSLSCRLGCSSPRGYRPTYVWSLLCACSQPKEALYKCGGISHGLMGLGPHCAWCVAKAHLLPPSAHWVNSVPRDSDAQLEQRSSGLWYPPGSQQGFPTWVGNLGHCGCHRTGEQRGTSDATLGTQGHCCLMIYETHLSSPNRPVSCTDFR